MVCGKSFHKYGFIPSKTVVQVYSRGVYIYWFYEEQITRIAASSIDQTHIYKERNKDISENLCGFFDILW